MEFELTAERQMEPCEALGSCRSWEAPIPRAIATSTPGRALRGGGKSLEGLVTAGLKARLRVGFFGLSLGAGRMPALVRPTWAASRRWETSKGAVAPTLAEPQGGSREAKLKEAEGKATTVGTRTGSEAGRGGELANDSETRRPSKARQVEPDGAG